MFGGNRGGFGEHGLRNPVRAGPCAEFAGVQAVGLRDLVSRQARGDLLLKQGYRGAALTRTEPREHIGIGELRTQSLAADEQTRQRAVGRSVTSPPRSDGGRVGKKWGRTVRSR